MPGLQHIAKLTNLAELDLSGTLVTDAGLVQLHALNTLRSLRLNETRITDAGLASLHDISKLSSVYASKTSMCNKSLKEFKLHLKKRRQAEAEKAARTQGREEERIGNALGTPPFRSGPCSFLPLLLCVLATSRENLQGAASFPPTRQFCQAT